jgi:hypothetical protein
MSANEYARQRGRDPLPGHSSQLPVNEKRALPPLSAAAQARVHQNRALVHEHMPEALPFIKELHELGMIDGWRNVEEVTLNPTANAGSLP